MDKIWGKGKDKREKGKKVEKESWDGKKGIFSNLYGLKGKNLILETKGDEKGDGGRIWYLEEIHTCPSNII